MTQGMGLILGMPLASDGGAPSLAPYLGQIATRSTVNNTFATTTAIMSRVGMDFPDGATSFRLLLTNWSFQSAGSELLGSATQTFRAAIEYPAGTFTQITWGGSASKVVAIGGDTGLCDPINLAIPVGARAWLRVFVTTPGTTIFCYNTATRWTAGGDAAVITGATDQTMSGTVVDGGSNNFIFPAVVVGTTTKASFVILGDSRAASVSTAPDSNGALGCIAPSLGAAVPWANYAVTATKLWHMTRNCPRTAELARTYFSHILTEYGINDVGEVPARGLAKIQYDLASFKRRFNTQCIIATTLQPTTTDPGTPAAAYSTLGQQSLLSSEGDRLAWNSYIAGLPTRISACCDINAPVCDLATGKWKVSAGILTGDGVHGNQTARNEVVNAGVINPVTLAALPKTQEFSPFQIAPAAIYVDVADTSMSPTSAPGTNQVLSSNRGVAAESAVFNVQLGSPGYSATGFNGARPAYTFTNTKVLYTQGAGWVKLTNGASGLTMAILLQFSGSAASTKDVFLLSHGATGGDNQPRGGFVINSAGKVGVRYRRLDAAPVIENIPAGGADMRTNTPVLLVATFDPVSNSVKFRVNGTEVGSYADYPNTGSYDATNSKNVVIGNFDGAWTSCFAGNGAASQADLEKLEGFMAWEAGVATTVLPVGHPYRAARPSS